MKYKVLRKQESTKTLGTPNIWDPAEAFQPQPNTNLYLTL